MDDLLATRTRLRSKSTKLCNDLRSYREKDRKAQDSDQLALKLHHLEKLQNELQGVQVQLDKLDQADESIHLQNIEDELFLGSRLLVRLERAEEAQDKTEHGSFARNTDLNSSLKVKIQTFHGDVMKWSEFWELFAISVHDNPGFAKVQKFVVLKSHLAGAALRSIQGIPVTDAGYTDAVEALKERFEQDDVRRETLMKELLNMPSVRHNDLKGMRSLIDHLTAHTRALNTLGVYTDSFSSLLLPVVKDKMPEDWRLEWARRESSDFAEFLRFLNKEIRLRESARGGETREVTSDSLPSAPTAARRPNVRGQLEHPISSHRPGVVTWHSFGPSEPEQDEISDNESVVAGWGDAKARHVRLRCLGIGQGGQDCKGSPRIAEGRQDLVQCNISELEHSTGASVAGDASPETEPGRKSHTQPCEKQRREILEKVESEKLDLDVGQPRTDLTGRDCRTSPCLERDGCTSYNVSCDPDLDQSSQEPTPVTEFTEATKPTGRQDDTDVNHCLDPELGNKAANGDETRVESWTDLAVGSSLSLLSVRLVVPLPRTSSSSRVKPMTVGWAAWKRRLSGEVMKATGSGLRVEQVIAN